MLNFRQQQQRPSMQLIFSRQGLKRSRHLNTGLSLVELMVSLTIGLIILSALLSLIVNHLKANSEVINQARLNQDLRHAMMLISRDLRRANYNPTIQGQLSTAASIQLANTIALSNCSGDLCSQLDYSYSSSAKRFTISDYTVKMSTGGGASQALTDPFVSKITSLKFCFLNTQLNDDPTDDTCSTTHPASQQLTVTGSSSKVSVYLIKVSIGGELKNDSTVTKSIDETIRVRNDAFF